MAKKLRTRYYPVEIDREDLKFRMQTAMQVAGLTLVDVADYMNTTIQVTVNAIDGQDYHLSLNFLVCFCAVCRCSINDILPFSNDEIPFPYTFAVRGGGAVAEIAPDPYLIGITNPESLVDVRWEVRPKTEF